MVRQGEGGVSARSYKCDGGPSASNLNWRNTCNSSVQCVHL
jgi:hypothetical protein